VHLYRFLFAPQFDQIVKAEAHPHEEGENYKRIAIGGNVQAARMAVRVPPQYPTVAREEHLSGTVKLHAIVGTDGRIRSLRVLRGKCSLARASVDAVRQWRYQPTLVNGDPVEVDTEN